VTTKLFRARAAAAVTAVTGLVLVTGCSAGAGHRPPGLSGPPGFWNRSRLLAALPFDTGREPAKEQQGQSRTAGAGAALRVGALFEHDASGDHFCTASVVSSPGKDLLITAAHCIHGGKGSGYRSDIVFIPGYRDGQEPFGVWTPAQLIVAPQWADSSDPDFDVGFVVLQPNDGRNIEQVLGANQLMTDTGYRYLVHVTGYPASANAPITCVNWTSRQSATQLRFECGGYTGGTSGSPWVTRFSTRSRTGTIVGVIGGYQEGGDTDAVSYSVRLDAAILRLYQQAVADGGGSGGDQQ
jgi:V8-like Glu-specific endopeptidase